MNAAYIQVLKLSKVFTVRLLLRKKMFDANSVILAAFCLIQQLAWILCLYAKKYKEKQDRGKVLKELKRNLKKLSPVVLNTVKKAKKGITTTVKLCKKTIKSGGDAEESLFMAWFWLIRLFASILLKAGKQMIRKRRLPKYNFLKKHFTRAAGYYTFLPALLLSFIYLIREVSPTWIPYLQNALIAFWVISNAYKEAVVGKPKKKKKKSDKVKDKKDKATKSDKLDKPAKAESEIKLESTSLINPSIKEEAVIKVVKIEHQVPTKEPKKLVDDNQETLIAVTWAINIGAFAEKINDVISITDYFVLFISMSVYELLCAANVSQEMELALQQAVLITLIQVLQLQTVAIDIVLN